MIKVDKGNIEIKGIDPTIRAEFSMIVRTLYKDVELSKEQIKEAVETGLMSDEEIDNRLKERFDKLFEELKNEMED